MNGNKPPTSWLRSFAKAAATFICACTLLLGSCVFSGSLLLASWGGKESGEVLAPGSGGGAQEVMAPFAFGALGIGLEGMVAGLVPSAVAGLVLWLMYRRKKAVKDNGALS